MPCGHLHIPIATISYDNLVEDITGLPFVTWLRPDLAQMMIRGDHPAILHLDGHYLEAGVVGLRDPGC